MTSSLVELLGHPAGTRAIILNGDDFGMCHAANTAIVERLQDGSLDSATIMMPCSWSPEAVSFAAAHRELDLGVHLVLTSEWANYRWRPLTGVRSTLVDDDGFFPVDAATVERTASAEDVEAELRAQLTAALSAGVDVTHLDNHMGSVYGLATGRDFLGPVLALAAEHGLPFRLPRSAEGLGVGAEQEMLLAHAVADADALGVILPDRLWSHPFALGGEGTPDEETYEQVRDGFFDLVRAVPAGVTEIYLHPMIDGDELRSTVDFGAPKRGYEHRLLADPALAAVLAEEGIVRVGWRDLRDVQRSADRPAGDRA